MSSDDKGYFQGKEPEQQQGNQQRELPAGMDELRRDFAKLPTGKNPLPDDETVRWYRERSETVYGSLDYGERYYSEHCRVYRLKNLKPMTRACAEDHWRKTPCVRCLSDDYGHPD